jgi:ribosomal protein S3
VTSHGLTLACCLWCSACYGVLRFIMESGAKGCEVIVSGKLRAQRAKAMKFKVHWSSAHSA